MAARRVVQTVDHEQQRLGGGGPPEDAPHRVGDAPTPAVRGRGDEVGDPRRQGRHQLHEGAAVVADPLPQHGGRARRGVPAQRLGHGLVGQLGVGFAAPVEHDATVDMGGGGQLGHEPGRADAGLAGDDDGGRPPVPHGGPAGQELRQLLVPSDHRREAGGEPRRQRDLGLSRVGFPRDLATGERLAEPLELVGPDRRALEATPVPEELPHDVVGEDLAGTGLRLETGRLDDGRPVPVTALRRRLADREADPDPEPQQRVGPAEAVDGPLHLDRAPGGVGERALERDHHAVAEVLDLGAAGVDHRLPEGGEVVTQDLVAGVVADGAEQVGGPDEVHEDERHRRGPAHRHGSLRDGWRRRGRPAAVRHGPGPCRTWPAYGGNGMASTSSCEHLRPASTQRSTS